jgi:hypothetical protein
LNTDRRRHFLRHYRIARAAADSASRTTMGVPSSPNPLRQHFAQEGSATFSHPGRRHFKI